MRHAPALPLTDDRVLAIVEAMHLAFVRDGDVAPAVATTLRSLLDATGSDSACLVEADAIDAASVRVRLRAAARADGTRVAIDDASVAIGPRTALALAFSGRRTVHADADPWGPTRPSAVPPATAAVAIPLVPGDGAPAALVLADRAGGYDAALVAQLRPVAVALAALLVVGRTAAELRAAKERADAANRAKSAFVAAMSHEIRTPVSAVRGALGLLEDAPLERDARRVLRIARQSADVLLTLIDDVLDFSKIEAGKLEVEIVEFDVVSLLDGVTAVLAARGRGSEGVVTTFLDPRVPVRWRGGRDRMRQVLLNLVGNAVKFAPGGHVHVSCEPAPGGLRFEVRDDGPGIPPERQSELFVEFTRLGERRADAQGGTGLGLAISRRLVELMGGRIGVVSAPGQGSTFWFTVACEALDEGRTLRGVAAGRRVLVCSDDALAASVQRQLEAWGAAVVSTPVPRHALDLVDDGAGARIDLVVLDSRGRRLAMQSAHDVIAARGRDRGIRVARVVDGAVAALGTGARGDLADHLLTAPIALADLLSCLHGRADGAIAERLDTAASIRVRGLAMAGRRIRVLLADDSQSNRIVTAEFLRRRGCDVDVAADGAEAVDTLRTLAYDVVLMDIDMPGVDGVAALRALREVRDAAATPVIAMTAHATAGAAEHYLALGFDDYLAKPFESEQLLAKVARWAPPNPMDTMAIVVRPARTAGRPAAAGVLDDVALDRLAEDVGRDRVPEMARIFAAELAKRRPRVRTARESGDLDALARESHALKSSAATFGARAVAAASQSLNDACRGRRTAAAAEAADELLDAIAPAIRAFSERYGFDLTAGGGA